MRLPICLPVASLSGRTAVGSMPTSKHLRRRHALHALLSAKLQPDIKLARPTRRIRAIGSITFANKTVVVVLTIVALGLLESSAEETLKNLSMERGGGKTDGFPPCNRGMQLLNNVTVPLPLHRRRTPFVVSAPHSPKVPTAQAVQSLQRSWCLLTLKHT